LLGQTMVNDRTFTNRASTFAETSQNSIDIMRKSAILLVSLGSPESPTTKDLKPYLEEFLMDERVIDIPKWLRALIVKGLIVPFRSPKSAAKYKTVWTEEGSPLIAHTRKQS